MSQREVPLDRLPALGPGAQGLGEAQVRAQRVHGFNDIAAQAASGWLVVARDTARDPMLWFLVLTAGLFGLLGQVTESLTLLAAIVPLLGMDAYLHRRTTASSTTSGPSSMPSPKAASSSRTCDTLSRTCCSCTCRW